MVNRATKLRWRRRVRHSQKHVENLGSQAEQGLEQHFFKRLNRFVGVRRFVVTWILLFTLLISGVVVQNRALSRFYQVAEPGQGGIYTEGILGAFTNANPLYATGPVDASVSRLVFSGLMKYDTDNKLVGDVAKSVEVDKGGTTYTAHLRENVRWHDGEQLTADDVAFTYQTIQKPDTKSPLIDNWQKVEIETVDQYTVKFTLPHSLASFKHTLTTGLLPEHILGKVEPSDLRSASFNTARPIGSGPFKWDAVQVSGNNPTTREEQIGLTANKQYHFNTPKLERFVIRAFHNEDDLIEAFNESELSGAAGLAARPDNLKKPSSVTEYNVPIMGEVMVFMKNSNPILKDKTVRKALVRATDQNEIVKGLGYPVVYARSPLLASHIGYRSDIVQATFNAKAAGKLLDKAGWKIGKDGVRHKKGKPLAINLYSQSDSNYAYVAQILQKQWQAIGVDVEVTLEADNKLQGTISSHSYDALLYGITIGSDPDVYAYWHSSQADPRATKRLNFSEYESSTADAALEAGRSRIDAKQRAAKYKPFLEAWKDDAPSIGLYQPRYLYLVRGKLYGFNPTVFNSSADRYANVENWAVRLDRVDIYQN